MAYRAGEARDRFGHWVAPPSAAGRPCPHQCCKNNRPHPRGLPVVIDRNYLRSLESDELERELDNYAFYRETHQRGALQVAAEIDRRADIARNRAARQERARRRRETAEQEYRDEVYRQWLRAESETRGVMLNRRGLAAGINERSLFSGPESRVKAYASPELVSYFEANPRPTRASYFGSATERRAHLAGRRIGLPRPPGI
jgi:hypothetical protein